MFLIFIFSSSLSIGGDVEYNYYSLPLTTEFAESILEVSTNEGMRLDQLLRFGFVFMDKNSIKIAKNDSGDYLLQCMMTQTNAQIMMSWVSRHQYKDGFLVKIKKKEIIEKLGNYINDPMFKKTLEVEKEMELELQRIRDNYK